MIDVFGLAIKQFLSGEHIELYIERDDGYISYENVNHYFLDYPYWDKCERLAIQYAKGRILDLGCGVGRHSKYLINKGFEVYSIDISRLTLMIAVKRGINNPIQMDINNLGLKKQSFDTILLLGGGLGLAGKIGNVIKLFIQLHNLVRENGVLIGSSIDPKKLTNYIHTRYFNKNNLRGLYYGTLKLRYRYNNLCGNWFYYSYIDVKMLYKICSLTNWKIKKIFRDHEKYSVVITTQ